MASIFVTFLNRWMNGQTEGQAPGVTLCDKLCLLKSDVIFLIDCHIKEKII